MEITTTHEVRPIESTGRDSQIIIHVFINGSEVHSFVVYSGPSTDVEEFMNGNAETWPKMSERWLKRRRVG